jgi:hypothetical protein
MPRDLAGCRIADITDETSRGPADAAEAAPAAGEWKFKAAIYGWISGIDGTVAAFGAPAADASASMGDVLDQFEASFMGLGEARHGRFQRRGDHREFDVDRHCRIRARARRWLDSGRSTT